MNDRPQSGPLLGERLSRAYEAFATVLTVSAAAAAAVGVGYLTLRWLNKLLDNGNWAGLFAVTVLAFGFVGGLAWLVKVRPRVALPIVITVLAFAVLPWFGAGGWRARRP